eukprot:3260939-Pleurochrysis_carterae.AAC.3
MSEIGRFSTCVHQYDNAHVYSDTKSSSSIALQAANIAPSASIKLYRTSTLNAAAMHTTRSTNHSDSSLSYELCKLSDASSIKVRAPTPALGASAMRFEARMSMRMPSCSLSALAATSLHATEDAMVVHECVSLSLVGPSCLRAL